MANSNRPQGARPIRQLNGSAQIPVNKYSVDSSNGTAIFVGDFVKQEADGNIAPAAAGNEVIGVAGSVVGDYGDLGRRYLPAATAGEVMVYDDPDTIFAVQEDDGGTPLAATSKGALVDHVAGAGSTTTSISAHELDQDSIGTTDGSLRLLRLVPVENNAYGDNAEWEVLINEHAFRGTNGI